VSITPDTVNGKTKYQASVWHKGEFYVSCTFDDESIAKKYHKHNLGLAAAGKLETAAERRRQRELNASCSRSMKEWASLYIADPDHKVKDNRTNEYELVGQLLEKLTLMHFQGKDGLKRLKMLKAEWLASGRLSRRKQKQDTVQQQPAVASLAPQTVRLRLTALIRIIGFAVAQLPEGAEYNPMPPLKENFTLPPAHESPRRRLPTDLEYSRILNYLGPQSVLALLVQAADETGCRLGEMLNAMVTDVDYFRAGDTIVGGCLNLKQHKTKHKTCEDRAVPLSLFAAEIFLSLGDKSKTGRLFEALRGNDSVCKSFDKACIQLGIQDLLLKDFRRAFINRNKASGVSTWDLQRIVGASTLLKKPTKTEEAIQTAVGHTDPNMTASYSVEDIQELSERFTRSSRRPRVVAASGQLECGAAAPERLAAKQVELAKLLAEIRLLGLADGSSSGACSKAGLPEIGSSEIHASATTCA
jgi:integrase